MSQYFGGDDDDDGTAVDIMEEREIKPVIIGEVNVKQEPSEMESVLEFNEPVVMSSGPLSVSKRKRKRLNKLIKPRLTQLKRKLKVIKNRLIKQPRVQRANLRVLEKIITNHLSLPVTPSRAYQSDRIKTTDDKISAVPMSSTKPEVKSKTKKKLVPKTTVICDECGLVIPNQSLLTRHKARVHDPNKPKFLCPIPHCLDGRATFKDARSLWSHYARKHMNLEELCPEVRQVTEKSTDPPKEKSGTSNSNRIVNKGTCEHCGKYFPRMLNRHINTVHKQILKTSDDDVKCDWCQKQFKSKCGMTAHVKRFHEGSEIIVCSLCGKNCATSGKLWKHRVELHGLSAEEEAASLGVQFEPCQFCGELVQKGRALRWHVEHSHSEDYPDWWAVEMVRRRERELEQQRIRTLRKSRKNKAGNRKNWEVKVDMEPGKSGNGLTCPKKGCGKKCADKKSVLEHLLTMHCDFEKRILEEKLVVGVGKSGIFHKFRCTLCGTVVFDRGTVRTHIVACHPNLYQCVLENRPFPKPEFKCAHCQTGRFKEDEELRRHVESCHEDKCWRCPECEKVMLSPEEMGEHFEVDHGNGGDKKEGTQGKGRKRLFRGRKEIKTKVPLEAKEKRRGVCGKEKKTEDQSKMVRPKSGNKVKTQQTMERRKQRTCVLKKLYENLEQEKRLIILVRRLTPEEIGRWKIKTEKIY